MKSGEYERVVFRELVIADNQRIVTIDRIDKRQEIDRKNFDIVGTPTVLFLDRKGNEIAKRQVGYSSSDYGTYLLERSIKAAIVGSRCENHILGLADVR